MNSIVADATRKQNLAHRGLKPTAKFKCRYAAESVKALLSWMMVIGLCVSFSIGGFGQDLEAARQFVQSANSSNAAQKLLREGRELVGERKWSAATTKFNDLIRAYPRDKNLDAALYWLAFCQKQQGRPKEANQTIERLIKEYPRSDWQNDARALRLELAGAMGNLDAAREIFKQELQEQSQEAQERAQELQERAREVREKEQEAQERAQEARERTQEVKERSQEARERTQEVKERAQEIRERAQESQERAQEIRERAQEAQERAQEAREREQPRRERGQRDLKTDDPDEALRLIALQSLFQADPERAMSVAVGFLSAGSKTSPAIQEAALGLIARHGGEKAWPALLDTARNQSIVENVREQAIYWIAQQRADQSLSALLQLYDAEKDAGLKDRLLYWLAQSNNERARAKIAEIARNDSSSELRDRAIYWVAQRGGEQSFNSLNELYGAEKDPAIKDRILYWFAQSKEPRAQARIIEIARNDGSSELRDRAIYWIAQRKGEESTDALIRLYDEQKEEEIQERILYWLGQRGGKAGLQKLFAVARSDAPQNLREKAVYYLAGSKDPEVIKMLEQILK